MARFVIFVAYVLMTAVLVAVSGWMMYEGYRLEFIASKHSEFLAVGLAAVVVVGLFACDYVLLDRRSKNSGLGSLVGVTLALCLFAVISFAANFHTIYKLATGSELARARYEQAVDRWKSNVASIAGEIDKQNKLPELVAKIKTHLDLWANEYIHPVRPGAGDEFDRKHKDLQAVVAELAPQLRLKPLPARTAAKQKDPAVNKIIDETRFDIAQAIKAAEQSNPWPRLTEEIVVKARAQTFQATAEPESMSAAVKQIEVATRELERRFKSEIERLGAKDVKLALLEPVSMQGAQLLRIGDSFTHAGSPAANPGHVAFATVLALLIDFLPLLFAVFVVKPAPRSPTPPKAEGEGAIEKPKAKMPRILEAEKPSKP